MKYSIIRQITAIFIALFVFVLGAVLIINNGFLGRYYLSHKTKDLIRTYNEIDDLLEESSLTMSVARGLIIRTERANIDLVVVDSSGDASLSTLSEKDPRFMQMISEPLGQDINEEDVLKRNDNFTVYRATAQGSSGSSEQP